MAYNYLIAIEETVDSGCRQRPYKLPQEQAVGLVNVANSIYKDNLKALNWDYGSMDPQDFKRIIFELTTQYNRTSCPITTPYVTSDGQNCFQCYGVFMLDTRKCEPCSNNQAYNVTLGKCGPKPP